LHKIILSDFLNYLFSIAIDNIVVKISVEMKSQINIISQYI